jgi:hypothetical protein
MSATVIVWATAAFGALVVGVATTSVVDELFQRTDRPLPRAWSREVLLRSAVAMVAAAATMALWVWFWTNYIPGFIG